MTFLQKLAIFYAEKRWFSIPETRRVSVPGIGSGTPPLMMHTTTYVIYGI